MAIIGKIRKRGGLIVIIIGIALAAFVLGDFIKKGERRHAVSLAVINGEKVSWNDFVEKVVEQEEMRKQQSGNEQLTATEQFQIKQMAWNQFLREQLMMREYVELGLAIERDPVLGPTISKEEFNDLIFGKNPHSVIIQNFTDPQTKQFNQGYISQFLNSVKQGKESNNPEQREMALKQEKQWQAIEEYIRADRLSTKYYNLIKKGYYVPKAFAKKDYMQRNRIAKFRIMSLRYPTIADSLVKISEEDYQKYYEKNKNRYDQEASRDIDYVVYEVLPSSDDMKKIEERVANVLTELKSTDLKEVDLVVNKYSETLFDSTYHKKGSLPLALDSFVFRAEVGAVFGPYVENNAYHLARLVDVQMRPDSMRASHILIAYQGAARAAENITRTPAQAKSMADSLFKIIKKDAKRFEELASTLSDDATAKAQAGDLKWFADGAMVSPFNNFCIKGKVGDIGVVETAFGYHVVKITGKKDPVKKVQVAQIAIKIEPTEETYNKYYAEASKFAGDNRTKEDFDNAIKKQGLNKRVASRVQPMDYSLPGLDAARELVQWAFDEKTKEGQVSDKVFEFDNKYVVACVKQVREKGIAPLEQIKDELKPLVIREKKAEMLIEKLNKATSTTKDIYQIAQNQGVRLDTLDFITFASTNIPGYGSEPYVIGKVFTMKKGQLSKPIKGEQGVYLVFIDDFIEPQPIKDVKTSQLQVQGIIESRVSSEVYQALEKAAKIKDNRILFY